MARANIEPVLSGFNLGEGPHWVAERGELMLVDILEQSIHRYVPGTKEHFQVRMDDKPAVIVPVEGQASKYIVGLGTDIVCFEWDGTSKESSIKTMKNVIEKPTGVVLNDGKCDQQGRFFVGTMEFGGSGPAGLNANGGNLFSLGLDGQKVTTHLDSLTLGNGLAWSSDYTRFFYIDSMNYRVDVFDYDLDLGVLSNRRVAYDFKKNGTLGMPDGMTIDSQNNLWVATYMGAKILNVDTTTGQLRDAVDFSGRTSKLTSVAFGGPHLDELYVTSANFTSPDLAPSRVTTEEGESGSLFRVTNVGVKGPPAMNYKRALPS